MIQTAHAEWRGTVREGTGLISLGSGSFSGGYSYPSRFESGAGTNPEELLAASHAGCFSMALASTLVRAGFTPVLVETKAAAHLEKVGERFAITRIELTTAVQCPDLDEAGLDQFGNSAKINCPISKALAGTEIVLSARLIRI